MKHVSCPVYVLAGSADPSTHPDESEAIFAAAPTPKQLWIVPGAGHVDLYRYAGHEYENRVSRFLQTYLRAAP